MDYLASSPELRIVLLGPPGSGKGTQGTRIASALGIPAVSTGDLLRRAMADGTPLGRRVEAIVSSGGLVDDETMLELVRTRLAEPDARRGFVLDGHPRTLPQAQDLDALLAADGRVVDAVVSIDVPEATLVARLAGRGRSDDRPEVVRERLRLYREATAPLVDYYRRRGLLRDVDGDRTVETVTGDVLARLTRGFAAVRSGASQMQRRAG